jgi:translation elongation factor EF-4
MPLSEMITDFFDQVKSRSKGYASLRLSTMWNKSFKTC